MSMSDSNTDETRQTEQASAAQDAAPAPVSRAPVRADIATDSAGGERGAFGVSVWLSLASLVIALVLAVAAFFFWDRQHQILDVQSGLNARIDTRLGDVDNVINRVRAGFDQFKAGEETRRLAADSRLDDLDRVEQDQARRLESLGRMVGRGSREWALAEVEFLLTLANHSLQLQRDVGTARVALQSADDALRALDDPAYLVVRERISAEIAALDAVPVVDRAGQASSLDALMAQVDQLPLRSQSALHEAPAEGAQPDHSPATPDWRRWESWKRLPAIVWDAVRQLVRIREHDRPLEPMVAPEKEYFLRQNLRLQLESARLALLREAPVIYRQVLETARGWITEYFDESDSGVAAVRERLAELASVNVRPDLPDISASLAALRQQLSLSGGRTGTSSDGATAGAFGSGSETADPDP